MLLDPNAGASWASATDAVEVPGKSIRQEAVDLLKLAWPLSLSDLARNLQYSTDLVILSHRHPGSVGAEQVAAVGTAYMWIFITDMPMVMGVTTLVTLCAKAFGAGNWTLAGTWTQITLLAVWAVCIPLIIARWCTEPLFDLIPGLNVYASQAGLFTKWLSFAMVPDFTYFTFRMYLASQGMVLTATLNDVIFVAFNALIGWLMVFEVFPSDDVADYDNSIKASAIGLLIARFLMCASYCTVCFLVLKLHAPTWRWDLKEVMQLHRFGTLFRLAVPTAFGSFTEVLQVQVFTYMAANLGKSYMAAQASLQTAICYNLFTISNGIANAAGIQVATYLGAGDGVGAKRVAYTAIGCAAALGVVLALFIFIFGRSLLTLVIVDSATLGHAEEMITWLVPCNILIFITFNTVFLILQKQGRTILPSIALWVGTWLIGCPLSYVFGYALDLKLPGLWYGQIIGYLCVMLANFAMLYASDWKQLALEARQAAEVPSPSL